MRIALAQLNYHIANFQANNQKIIQAINKARDEKADLIVFAELAIGGYPAKDLLRNQQYLQACQDSIQAIATHCKDISCIIGAPTQNKDHEGKALYNSALLIENGEIQQLVHKSFLPDYDIFDEYRYFEPNKRFNCIDFKGYKLALTICEDLWDDDGSNSYVGDLMAELRKEKPDYIINLAASPFSYMQQQERFNVLKRQAIKAACPLIYVNQVGAHTDIIFDGRSMVLNKIGELTHELKKFEEDFYLVDFAQEQPSLPASVDAEIALIHKALILGLRDYFRKSNFKQVVLGLSGGLDSALVAALACEALGAENVLAILMPSKYSSDHSIKDALDLVANTGCRQETIAIGPMVEAFEASLGALFAGKAADTTEENIQARVRGTLLMAISNKFGHILLNTSNKSEAAVGYGTLYGDMAGSLSVIGDVYKSQAFRLAEYMNREREIIPVNTIVKPPSAELRPDQKDADSLPPYELLDSVLFQLIELEKSAQEVIHAGFDQDLVLRIAKLLNNAEFKRFQAPPILRVSPKAFGSGREFPLVAKNLF